MRRICNLHVTDDVTVTKSDEWRKVLLIPHSLMLARNSTRSPTCKSDFRCINHQPTRNLERRDCRTVEASRKRLNRPLSDVYKVLRDHVQLYSRKQKIRCPWRRKAFYICKCSLCVRNCLGIQGPLHLSMVMDGSNCGPRLKYCTYTSIR